MNDQYEGGRNSAMAVTLTGTNDGGKEQLVSATGLAGETFTKVQRMQPFGLSAHAPNGSIGIGICPGSRRDLVVVICAESADKRPTDTAEGDTKLYNAEGANLHLEGKKATLSGVTSIVLDVGGGVSLTIDASGFHFAGGSVDHDGVNISKTHVHGGIRTGTSDTEIPH